MQNPRPFGIALMSVLLEHPWPENTRKVITQVHDALVSGDAEQIRAASAAAASASASASYASASYAASASASASASAYASYASASAYASYAYVYARSAVPSESERIDALYTLFK